MPGRYLITTPIYYPNAVPHIGTALTTLAADVTARYQRMQGENVYFLTGTDENGLKLKEAAESHGRKPLEFVADISNQFRKNWDDLFISWDDFIRTTEPRHIKAAQELFTRLKDRGYVYLDMYEGWYDVSTETFYRESELVDGMSPDGNPVRKVTEENYFFKLSAFGDRLLEHIENNPDFLIPAVRRNEAVSFIKQGLRDVSISRQNPGWGIPVPGDEGRVIYVWFDALISYLTCSGWPDKEGWDEIWPASVHWMAKDIFSRFHAVLWPAMLMGADLPLPRHVVGHGWLMLGGEKISKSKGNVIAPLEMAKELEDRVPIRHEIAVDAERWGLLSIIPFEADTTLTMEAFDLRCNNDLANDIGNGVNRTLAMAHKFVSGTVPTGNAEAELASALTAGVADVAAAFDRFRIDHAIGAILGIAHALNGYIDARAPWALAKAEDPALPAVLRSMLLAVRTMEGVMRPIMPHAADAIAAQLNLPPLTDWKSVGTEASLPAGTKLNQPEPIFPRLDLKSAAKSPAPKPSKDVAPQAKPTENHESAKKDGSTKPAMTADQESSQITIEDFAKVKLKVARIFEAEPLEGSDKLMKLQVTIGEERRQIIAGIRKDYSPEELIGRQIIVVANLKPAKLRGAESQGMLLAATSEDGGAILLQPDREAPEGTGVK